MLSAPQPTRLASLEKLEYKRWSWQERGLLFPDLTFHLSFPLVIQGSQSPSWKELSPLSLIQQLQSRKVKDLSILSKASFCLKGVWEPHRPPPPHQAPQCREKSGLRPSLRDGVRLGDWLQVRMKAGIRVQLDTRLAVLLWP